MLEMRNLTEGLLIKYYVFIKYCVLSMPCESGSKVCLTRYYISRC